MSLKDFHPEVQRKVETDCGCGLSAWTDRVLIAQGEPVLPINIVAFDPSIVGNEDEKAERWTMKHASPCIYD